MKKVRSMTEVDSVLPTRHSDWGPSVSPPSEQASSDGERSAGALLRDARLANRLELSALATLLKVPVKRLQALEQDRFDLLIDPAFARALAGSVCRLLKLDPVPILQRLPPITAFSVTSQSRGINAPFRMREDSPGSSVRMRFSRPAVLLGLALLLGAVGLIFLPFIQQQIAGYRLQTKGAAATGESVERISATEAPVGSPAVMPSSAFFAASNYSVKTPLAGATQAPIPAPVNAPEMLQRVSSTDTGATPTISFSAKGESWVKVTDAKGVVVLSRTLQSGESVVASGALPLVAVVGRADAVLVRVRGEAFDLNAVAKTNVARFEVK